jgi:hypothetical protein
MEKEIKNEDPGMGFKRHKAECVGNKNQPPDGELALICVTLSGQAIPSAVAPQQSCSPLRLSG